MKAEKQIQRAIFRVAEIGERKRGVRIQDDRPVSQALRCVQLKEVSPQIADGTRGTLVTLHLDQGDYATRGSAPSVNVAGWTVLRTLGFTAGDNEHKWVRFHLLNENAGGPGNSMGNLTATTAKANRCGEWNDFEGYVKALIHCNAYFPAKGPVDFSAAATYPGGARTVWKKDGAADVVTDAADYPNKINASLKYDGPDPKGQPVNIDESVELTNSEGVYGPEVFDVSTAGYTKQS